MSPDAIRGLVLISFPAPPLHMSMVKFLYPEMRTMTTEMISELTSFSLTVHTRRNSRITPVQVPKAPGQAVLDRFG